MSENFLHRAYISIPLDLLREVLALPEQTNVFAITVEGSEAKFHFTHPDIPEQVTNYTPEVSPVWSQPLDGAGNPTGSVGWKVLT